MDEETGEVRIEVGEQVVFLGPTEVPLIRQRSYYFCSSYHKICLNYVLDKLVKESNYPCRKMGHFCTVLMFCSP